MNISKMSRIVAMIQIVVDDLYQLKSKGKGVVSAKCLHLFKPVKSGVTKIGIVACGD